MSAKFPLTAAEISAARLVPWTRLLPRENHSVVFGTTDLVVRRKNSNIRAILARSSSRIQKDSKSRSPGHKCTRLTPAAVTLNTRCFDASPSASRRRVPILAQLSTRLDPPQVILSFTFIEYGTSHGLSKPAPTFRINKSQPASFQVFCPRFRLRFRSRVRFRVKCGYTVTSVILPAVQIEVSFASPFPRKMRTHCHNGDFQQRLK